jgi:hypothetical protein
LVELAPQLIQLIPQLLLRMMIIGSVATEVMGVVILLVGQVVVELEAVTTELVEVILMVRQVLEVQRKQFYFLDYQVVMAEPIRQELVMFGVVGLAQRQETLLLRLEMVEVVLLELPILYALTQLQQV